MNIYSQLYHDYEPPLTPFLYDLSHTLTPIQRSQHSISYLSQDLGSPMASLKLEDTGNIWGLIEEPFELEVLEDKKEHLFEAEDTLEIGIVVSAREKQESMLTSYFQGKRQRSIDESDVPSTSFVCGDSGRKTKKVKKTRIILKKD